MRSNRLPVTRTSETLSLSGDVKIIAAILEEQRGDFRLLNQGAKLRASPNIVGVTKRNPETGASFTVAT
jgi:hypothetical protein